MMNSTNLGYIAAAIAVIALILALFALLGAQKMKKSYAVLQGSGTEVDFVTAVARQVEVVNGLRTDVTNLRKDLTVTQRELKDAIRHVAVTRYDAFGDQGGRMSFSVAFLDDVNDGIVITSINGRTEGRTYIKGIKSGESIGSELSPEESQAIGMAQKGQIA
jgi:hypothetical protein